MTDSKRSSENPRATTTWVHVFEQDTPEGAVYLPEDADIPLSRRPRERIELGADGEATFLVPGPDDRYRKEPARWAETNQNFGVGRASNDVKITILERSPQRLVVKVEK